ncbi:MAG: outer membrane beta-barrel protein [Bacteroidota bacterium]
MKMTHLFCILFLLLCISTISRAQSWNLKRSWAIDLVLGIDYGFRTFKHLGEPEDQLAVVRQRSHIEKPSYNLRIGFNYNRLLSDRWAIKTGLRLINPGFRSGSSIDIREGDDWKLENSQFAQDGYDYRFQYLFLEIPTMFRYVYSRNWCKSYLEAGLSHNFYLHSKINQQREGEAQSFKGRQNLKPYNISAALAIGGEILLERQWSIFIQMGAHYQLTPLREQQVKEYLVSLGLESGWRMMF